MAAAPTAPPWTTTWCRAAATPGPAVSRWRLSWTNPIPTCPPPSSSGRSSRTTHASEAFIHGVVDESEEDAGTAGAVHDGAGMDGAAEAHVLDVAAELPVVADVGGEPEIHIRVRGAARGVSRAARYGFRGAHTVVVAGQVGVLPAHAEAGCEGPIPHMEGVVVTGVDPGAVIAVQQVVEDADVETPPAAEQVQVGAAVQGPLAGLDARELRGIAGFETAD